MLNKKPPKYYLAIVLVLFISSNRVFSQKVEASGDEKIARQFFLFGDYTTALKEYQYLYSVDSTNPDFIYPLGICYLNTNIDKLKAIPFLEKTVQLKDFDAEAMYQLGLAYHIAGRFDEAIECYQKFKKLLGNGKDENYIPVEREIEMCENAEELVKNPVDVKFENAGSQINSPFPDYNPFVNKKETILYYASKRQGNMGNLIDYDGYNTADILYSESKYGAWIKYKRLVATLNTPLVEEICGLSSDGSYLFAYVDNLEFKNQACVTVKEGKSFIRFKVLGANINTSKANARSVAITPDKKIIFFSSLREDGQGGSDIYMSRILPSGQWGPAVNIGKEVNTKYDEDYPYLAPDGKTFYFASMGHNSMGGFDIFKCTWNHEDNTFSEPVNLGYPVNTPEDNTTISFTGSGRYAYISALRKDTYGNLDIYRLIFNDVKPGYTNLIGTLTETDSTDMYKSFHELMKTMVDSLEKITDSLYVIQHNISDSLNKVNKASLKTFREKADKGPDISIKVTDKYSGGFSGTYKPNSSTGKFIVIIPPGEFLIKINCEGYQELTETIKIDDRETPIAQITKTYRLSKK